MFCVWNNFVVFNSFFFFPVGKGAMAEVSSIVSVVEQYLQKPDESCEKTWTASRLNFQLLLRPKKKKISTMPSLESLIWLFQWRHAHGKHVLYLIYLIRFFGMACVCIIPIMSQHCPVRLFTVHLNFLWIANPSQQPQINSKHCKPELWTAFCLAVHGTFSVLSVLIDINGNHLFSSLQTKQIGHGQCATCVKLFIFVYTVQYCLVCRSQWKKNTSESCLTWKFEVWSYVQMLM